MSIQFGPEWEQLNLRLQRTPQVQEADVRRILQASLLTLEADARSHVSRDTGRLGSSITHRIDGVWPRIEGQVGPGTNYGIVVEFGRRAGARMPPVDALIPWVRRHFFPAGHTPGRSRFQGRARNRAWQGRDRELRDLAFVVARSIARKGIAPRPYMSTAWDRNRVRIQQAFARVGVRTVAYLAGRPLP